MKVIALEDLKCVKGPEAWFTGDVWIYDVVAAGTAPVMQAARVTFSPGARTTWHTHPRGQALHVLSGVGWVQLDGQAPQRIRAGDSVWIEAGERHWHGAAANRSMVHLAMQNADEQGQVVTWLEAVTDAEYPA